MDEERLSMRGCRAVGAQQTLADGRLARLLGGDDALAPLRRLVAALGAAPSRLVLDRAARSQRAPC